MGRAHEKQWMPMPYFDAKKYIKMYKTLSDGYTKNEINNSTTSNPKNRQQNLYISDSYQRISFSIDTRFFTHSTVLLQVRM